MESFETGYENLDNFFHEIQIKNEGGTESISNSIVPHKIVKEGLTKKIKDFSLTEISGDKRLLSLLPEKSHNYYILSITKSLQIFNFTLQILLGRMALTTIICS